MKGFKSIIRNACLLRPPLSLPGTVLPFFAGQQNTSQQQHEGSAGTDIKESLFENNILTLIAAWRVGRSEEHTSELQSPVPISYAVFCLKKKKKKKKKN